MKTKKKIFIFLILIVLAIGGYYWLSSPKAPEQQHAVRMENRDIREEINLRQNRRCRTGGGCGGFYQFGSQYLGARALGE